MGRLHILIKLIIMRCLIFSGIFIFACFSPAKEKNTEKATFLVANKHSNTLSFINPETFKVIETIYAGPNPHEIIVTPDQRFAYLTNYAPPGNTISVIDLIQRKQIKQIQTGEYTRIHGCAMASDGRNAYFTAGQTGFIVEIDTRTNEVTRAIPTHGKISHMVYVSPDNKRLYTANIVSENVSVIDRISGELITQIPCGKGVEGMAFTPDGKYLWAANQTGGTITIIEVSTNTAVETFDCPGMPVRIKFTADGKLALIPGWTKEGVLTVIDVASRKEIKRIRVGGFAIGVELTPDGKYAFVGCEDSGKKPGEVSDGIHVIDMNTLAVKRKINTGLGPDPMIMWYPPSQKIKQKPATLQFNVQTDVAHQELSSKFCWFHPRAAAIPGYGKNGNPAVIMTIQKHLVVSDFYSGMYYMRTDDLGKNWTGPFEIPELAWQYEPDGTTVSVADVTPLWHEKMGKLIAIGIKVRYSKEGRQLLDKPRSHDAAYSVFDPVTNKWTSWKMVANVPEPDSKFYLVNPGCVQWLVKPDGKILLPVYFSGPELKESSVTVFECSFDGTTLSYIRHGDEMTIKGGRGLGEPSIAFFKGTYYLTMRNDFKGYVSTSRDGMDWEPFKPWTFDDGQELGSYNTQAHWLVHSDGLFLSYTRRGANNDHIARNRAPLFLAEVDPVNLNVIRSTEKVLMPERGVMLGNFGASAITKNESWVTDAEFMVGEKPHPRGADGTVWVARVIWSKQNKSSGLTRPVKGKIGSDELKSESLYRILPGPDNPRNSEGDFITLKNGRILFIYSRYTGSSGADHASAFLAGRYSDDGGKTWSKEDMRIVEKEGTMNVMSVSLLRLQNGTIALFYLKKNSVSDCIPMVRISNNEALTWSQPRPCITDKEGYFVVANNRVIQLKSGRVLMPVASLKPGWKGYSEYSSMSAYYSDDNCMTWKGGKEAANPDSVLTQEPEIVELKDGSILMVMRTDAGVQYKSVSKDKGETWSPAEKSNIISPLSPVSIARIPSTGHLLLAWNNNGVNQKRTPLCLAISKDEGFTWEKIKLIEDDPSGSFCYPAIHFYGKNVLLSYWNRADKNNSSSDIRLISLSSIYKQ